MDTPPLPPPSTTMHHQETKQQKSSSTRCTTTSPSSSSSSFNFFVNIPRVATSRLRSTARVHIATKRKKHGSKHSSNGKPSSLLSSLLATLLSETNSPHLSLSLSLSLSPLRPSLPLPSFLHLLATTTTKRGDGPSPNRPKTSARTLGTILFRPARARRRSFAKKT